MKEYNFTLVYKMPKSKLTAKDLIKSLEDSGCSDVFTGMEDSSKVSLSFNLEASSLSQAMNQARFGVSSVIVGATLEEISVQDDE